MRSLLIENFRAIQHVDLTLQRRVTVLIGENGCGKSSILNALEAVLGRNVPKDSFAIKASDFHRHAFNDPLFEVLEDPQATAMRIVIGFGGGYFSNSGSNISSPEPRLGDSLEQIPRADQVSAQLLEGGDSEDKRINSLGHDPRALRSDHSLAKFCNDKFMIDLALRNERTARVFSFYLCIEATREGQEVTTHFHFENSRHQLIELENPLDYLRTIKTVCPLLRIRSGSLLPPITDNKEAQPAQANVDSVFSQAYSELTENAAYSAKSFIAAHREQLENSLDNLEKMLVHGSGAWEDLESEIDAAADSAPEGSNTMDRYTKTLSDESQRNLAIIKERLSAPLSTLNPLYNESERAREEQRDYDRFSALLRGTGARSLAMLAFADSFFKAQAQDNESSKGGDYCPLLSVEDPEAYLHPLMLTSVWSLIDRMSPQRLLSTNSSDLLSATSLTSMRRLVHSPEGLASVYKVRPEQIHINDLRRIAYHLRIRRGTALFMRFWLLVEGETECWLLPEIARAMGYDLWGEGIEFVEFAQCGLAPLANLANELGISWHLLADGDKAGETYGKLAAPYAKNYGLGRVTVLKEQDIESCFWENGFDYVFKRVAGPPPGGNSSSRKPEKPRETIKRAIRVASKPGLALALGRAMQEVGPEGIPVQLRSMIYDAVRTARHQGRP